MLILFNVIRLHLKTFVQYRVDRDELRASIAFCSFFYNANFPPIKDNNTPRKLKT